MPRLVSVGVAVIALALTGVLTGFSAAAHRSSEEHLLQLQVRQAAAAVSASVPSIQAQIADALEVASATKANPRTFSRFFAAKIDPSGSFASASLWRLRDGGATELASTGSAVQLVQDGRAQAFFARVHPSSRLFVTAILPGPVRRIGYAYMAPGTDSGLLVYTESRLPSKQRVTVPPSSAFQDLNFALYLGPKERSADLIETSVRLPITGLRAAASVPIGDRVITLVGAPARDLTDALSAALPWIVLAVGIVLSLGSAGAVEYVSRRRRVAEELAAENAVLYLEQRGIAGTLQRALLPSAMPDVGGIEVGARYLPGVSGIDVGGDWYDVIDTADGRCIFVVGDVSGRGLHAATTMASLRYATRAYALEG
ncbi:MAG: PP2C family protein-serine/threonine phosphatase, partial [Acidimicrobiales bacterium]